MKKSERKVIIAGNWKMNRTAREGRRLTEEIKAKMPDADCLVVLCVPAIDIPAVSRAARGSPIHVGAQNCHWEKSGAYTGEISRDMLREYRVKYSVIGHSERRQYFGETDETVNRRAAACLGAGITPIICVGEDLSQRERGETAAFVTGQVEKALAGFDAEQALGLVIAYEPIWAIGTGKTATARQAREVCGLIRRKIAELFGEETAKKVPILYGGSMNAGNASSLLAMEDIDGGLIGGASLKAEDFVRIIRRTEGEK